MIPDKQSEVVPTCSTSSYPLIELELPQQKRVLRSNSNSIRDLSATDVSNDKSQIGTSSSLLSPFSSNDDHPTSKNSSISTSNPETCTLRVVPPPFTIFLSRLEYGTKPSDIIDYIIQKNIDTSSIRCLSLTADNLQGRMSASFKLIAPLSTGKIIVNPDFWPRNMLVKEFINRPSPRISSSKNSQKSHSSTRT